MTIGRIKKKKLKNDVKNTLLSRLFGSFFMRLRSYMYYLQELLSVFV